MEPHIKKGAKKNSPFSKGFTGTLILGRGLGSDDFLLGMTNGFSSGNDDPIFPTIHFCRMDS